MKRRFARTLGHIPNGWICGGEGNPLNIVIAFNNRGNAYVGKRDHERAIADYRKALSLKIDETNKK